MLNKNTLSQLSLPQFLNFLCDIYLRFTVILMKKQTSDSVLTFDDYAMQWENENFLSFPFSFGLLTRNMYARTEASFE